MMTSKLNDIQNAQLYIMDDIHRVCIKHNLKYYLIGGSALGAVRHRGFIPWDVDIDIAMPRQDYKIFSKIANSELKDNLIMYNYSNHPKLLSPHMIVVLKNSKLTFKFDLLNPHIKRDGIYVDILPLDLVPESQIKKLLQKKILKILRGFMEFRMMRNYEGDSSFKRIVKKMIIPIIYSLPTSPISAMLQRVAQWGDNQEYYQEVCSMLSHYRYEKLCMPKEWFGNPVLSEFEGRNYFIPSCTESYLSKLFGDYMKLPSIEEQNKYYNMIHQASFDYNIIE